jgi:hypothetical protein
MNEEQARATRARAIPLVELAKPERRSELESIDLIVGCDTATEAAVLFYGRSTLEQLVASGTGRKLSSLVFSFNSQSEELEYLIATCQAIKGSCDDTGHRPLPWGIN